MRALFIVFGAVFLFASVESEPVPTHCFGRNEELGCVTECPPQRTCQTRDALYKCVAQDKDDKKCETKCVCKEGFYRNPRGECISNEHCDMCTGPHEYYSCGSACDNECATLHEQNQTNCPIVNIVCNEKCYCEEGHARDSRNICVPIDKCGNSEKCAGANEDFNPCKKHCPPELCFSIVARFACLDEPCHAECACKPGFLRKSAGSPCIPIRECPELANAPE